ncbi:hypothetical protein Ancab_038598 [Ancistrocladus abbreviatus]
MNAKQQGMVKVDNFIRESKSPHYDIQPLLDAPGSSVCPLTSENHATTGKGAPLKSLECNDDGSCQQNRWRQGVQQENMGCGSKHSKMAGASGKGHGSSQRVLSIDALMEDGTTTSRKRDKSEISEHPPIMLTKTIEPGLVCSRSLTSGDPCGPSCSSDSSGKSPKEASVAKRAVKSKRSKPKNLSSLKKKKRASNKSPAATGIGGKHAISRDSPALDVWCWIGFSVLCLSIFCYISSLLFLPWGVFVFALGALPCLGWLTLLV